MMNKMTRQERRESKKQEHDAAVKRFQDLVAKTRAAIEQNELARARLLLKDCDKMVGKADIDDGYAIVLALYNDIENPEQAVRRRQKEQERSGNHAEQDEQQHLEEQERLKKLQQIIKVSESLEISRLADLLKVNVQFVWDHIINWAEQFGFKIKENVVIFGQGNTTAFVDELQRQFDSWDDKIEHKDGKI